MRTNTPGLDQLNVANSQFNCGSAGIGVESGPGAGNLNVNSCLFLCPPKAWGIYLDSDLSTTIIGNIFQYSQNPNKSYGVYINHTKGPGGLFVGNRLWGLSPGLMLGTHTSGWNGNSNIFDDCGPAIKNLGNNNTIGWAP